MAKAKTWRQHATPIISQIIKDNKGKSDKEIRALLREAYPFGIRDYHPYHIWLDEIRNQLGQNIKKKALENDSINQLNLFQ